MAMPFLPSKQQAQALLLKRELELKQAEEDKRRLAAFREDFMSYLREYSSPLVNLSSPISPVTPQVSSIQPRPPDRPYLNPSELCHSISTADTQQQATIEMSKQLGETRIIFSKENQEQIQEKLNLKKMAVNPLSLEGDESVLLMPPKVGAVVDGRNPQMLARNSSSGQEKSRNLENSLGNFVEHLVGQKQQEVSVVENPKMEWYSDGFGLQALLSISSVTSPLPKKPPDPPDMIHGKSRNKGTIFPKYSCEEMYERMEMGLCVFCEEFDTQGHYQLKHKGLQVLVMECDDEEKVEELVDSVSVVLDQQEKKATDQEYEHAKAKLEDYCSLPNEHQDDSALLIESSNDIEFSDSHTNVLSRSELALCISGNEEKHCVCLSQVERIWEPGGLPTEAAQWYWPEKCKSLRVSAATSDLRLTRQLHIQTKELLSEFQDVPRLLVSAFEFGAKIHKPPDPNEKLLDDETLGKFRRVKVLMAEVSFDLVPSKEDHIILENEIKWKLRETSEAEVNYGFHSRWGFTAVVTAEWRRPRAYFHTTYEKMVCSREAMHLVDGMCIHGFEAKYVWDPGGLSAKAALLDWPETYQNRGGNLKLTFHESCIESLVMLLKLAKEIQAGYEWLISNSVKEFAATDIRMRFFWETVTDVTVALVSGCGMTNDFTEYTNWSQQRMQDHAGFNLFLFGIEMFQVKHKWRYKPFPMSELELKDVLSCYLTGQARHMVVSLHVEVRRTIKMSQVLLLVTDCYGDLTSYGEVLYINFQCYKPVQVMAQEDRNSLKVVQAHKKAVTRCLVQWKEHPPDQVLKLSSLRTRMF